MNKTKELNQKLKFSVSRELLENICNAIFTAYVNSDNKKEFYESYVWAKFRLKLIDSEYPNLINIYSDHAKLVVEFNGKRFEFIIDIDDADKVSKYKWNLVFAKNKYYAQSKIDNKHVFLHKFISGIYGLNGNRFNVTHKDGNEFNNRKTNLEIIVMSIRRLEDAMKIESENSITGRKGVSLSTNSVGPKYYAYGTDKGKMISLGFFDDLDEASEAAKKFRVEKIKKEIEKDNKDLEEWKKKQENQKKKKNTKKNTKNQK